MKVRKYKMERKKSFDKSNIRMVVHKSALCQKFGTEFAVRNKSTSPPNQSNPISEIHRTSGKAFANSKGVTNH